MNKINGECGVFLDRRTKEHKGSRMAIMNYVLCINFPRRDQRSLTEVIECCNSPLVFRRKIEGTMAQMRAITLLLKITEEFLGGVPRRGEVVIIPHSALRIK